MIELAAHQYGRHGDRRIVALLRDELLNGEIFYILKEAQALIESWRRHYNAARPHNSLGYGPPAPETVVLPSWMAGKPAMH